MSDCFYHPNIVRCYSSFHNQDHFYILMEYVGYRTLDDLSVPLNNQKQIVNLIIQLSLGLKHLKDKKVVHRDIKPTNIIISDKGLLKIVDFGISRIIQYDN
jgi:serine/threonine protein kinase